MSDVQPTKDQSIVSEIARVLVDDVTLADLDHVSTVERGSTHWSATIAKQNGVIHVAIRITVPPDSVEPPVVNPVP